MSRLGKALENVIEDFLGQAEDRPVSFGSLDFLLTSLVEAANAQISTNAEQREALEEALFAPGGVSHQFEATLAGHVASYPSKLKRLMMGRFTGNDELADLLESYQKKGRAYCGYIILDQALAMFRSRLLALSVGRKLITSEECTRQFFSSVQDDRNDAFREGSSQLGMRQGVLERMGDIETVFVEPLLNGWVGPESDLIRSEAAQSHILQNWRGHGGKTLIESFRTLVGMLTLDRNSTRTLTFDQALADSQIVDQLRDLVTGLRGAFESAEQRIFRPAIEDTSVWEGIRRYLRMQEGDPDATLKGLFSGYADRAAFFPVLSGKSRSDSFEPARYNYCICRMDDAELAFERLNFPNPKVYLNALFTHAFGYAPRPIPQMNSSSFSMSILRMIEGELPTHYEGYEELSNLLRLDSVEKVAASKRLKAWSDWRFPDWIHQWHKQGGSEFLIQE